MKHFHKTERSLLTFFQSSLEYHNLDDWEPTQTYLPLFSFPLWVLAHLFPLPSLSSEYLLSASLFVQCHILLLCSMLHVSQDFQCVPLPILSSVFGPTTCLLPSRHHLGGAVSLLQEWDNYLFLAWPLALDLPLWPRCSLELLHLLCLAPCHHPELSPYIEL